MPDALPQYQSRDPEDSLLYAVVAGELETFLAAQRERGHETGQHRTPPDTGDRLMNTNTETHQKVTPAHLKRNAYLHARKTLGSW
jgi:hypothetical protein